jgi:AcrR family transcriptional regulator
MPAPRESHHVSRDERRRRTETTILDAAREQFAGCGFERTTIRSVARAAGVDPALVMQYYGSKEGLFAAAARWPEESQTVTRAGRAELPAAALHDLFERFEGQSADREAAVALLRSCLTHPEAARIMRDEVMCDRIGAVGTAIGSEDGELRAGLLGACMIGVAMARHVLEIDPVARASRDEIERVLGPALQAIVDGAVDGGG